MDLNSTIDLIIKDLEEARGIIDDLKRYRGVPAIQVELAKSKCKSAAEVISLLKKNIEGEEAETPVPIASARIIEKETTAPSVNKITIKEEAQRRQKSVIADEKKIAPEPETQSETTAKPIPDTKTDSSIIADRFSQMSPRINEQIGGAKTQESIKEMIHGKPVNQLSEAIGINDRFIYVREIFKNDSEAYSQALIKLEKAISIEDAKAVIMSYTGESNENDAVKELLDLVKRKLSGHE